MGSGQQGWEEGRLWNIFPITSGMLLHCLQPRLADSGFPGLVPRGNKSRSCSHPRPLRGTNLNQELLEPKEGAGATGKPATCWSCWIFPHCAFLLMLDPCAQPDSRLWEREESVLPAQKSNCFQFTQTTMLDSEKFLLWMVSSWDFSSVVIKGCKQQAVPHFPLLLLHSALPLSCPLWHNVQLHQSEVYFWNEHEIAWNLSRKTQATLLIMEQINLILSSHLWIICLEKTTEILPMASRACSISLGWPGRGMPRTFEGFWWLF